jgi:hypothetical protein
MAVKNQVLVEFAPKITPTKIEMLDHETKDAQVKALDPSSSGHDKQRGKKFPFVSIGGFSIPESDLLSFNLFQNDFLPNVNISFIDSAKIFTSEGFPTTNPIVSVFVAPTNKLLKSIAGDYLITNIRSVTMPDGRIRYDYVGELYVPKLNTNKSIAYSKMTSVDAMRAIAKDLQLGFATNENQTSDTMTWINPNLSYKTFIQKIADRAYTNEKSFYQVFIDRGYVLNFINVEKQYSRDQEVDVTYLGMNTREDIDDERTDDISKNDSLMEVPMVLTYSKASKADDMKILDYSPISENGSVLMTESFRKRINWYRHNDGKLDFFIEPLSDLKPEGGKVHQTPILPEFTEEDIIKWIGIDYNNAHENYKFARVINMHNEKELYKNQLKVTLNGANFSVPRGSRVRVVILRESSENIFTGAAAGANYLEEKSEYSNDVKDESIDKNLSDFYYVKEVVVRYRKDNSTKPIYTTEMILSKRNWLPERQKLLTPTR